VNSGGIYAGPPKPARSVQVSRVTSNSVVLSWKQTSLFESVLIRYRMIDGGTDIMCEESYDRPGVDRLAVLGLSQGTDYEFYVAFVNRRWCSPATGPHYVSTGIYDVVIITFSDARKPRLSVCLYTVRTIDD